jgi:hypothetical protein
MRRSTLRAALCAIWLGLVLLPAARARAQPSAAEARSAAAPASKEARFVPTLGVVFAAYVEELSLSLAQRSVSERRRDFLLAPLVVGLRHPLVAPFNARTRLDGHVALGLGAAFHSGAARVLLREDVRISYTATHWLALHAGLGVGFGIDTMQPAHSQIELAAGLSFTLFDCLELGYRPYFSLPLGSEHEAVFAGSRRLSAGTEFVPIDFVLRGHFRSLSF